jgi:DNA-binding response OmpR family regulator
LAKKILIVDDSEKDMELVKHFLEMDGSDYDIVFAKDGLEALEKARTEKPDLIILDLMLPKMDGFKVCRLLKFDEKFKHIPVILLTMLGDHKDKETGKNVGADAYMAKPFDSDVLHEQITKLIGEKS